MVIFPFFHLFKPSFVPSQRLPSLPARMALTAWLDNPCWTDIVVKAKSRKRSSPSTVTTQILPSRSSNREETPLPDSPSDRVNRSILPLWICNSPLSITAPIHRPPSWSRNSAPGENSNPEGSGYGSAFPFLSFVIPLFLVTRIP